jgi:hypothetical protein
MIAIVGGRMHCATGRRGIYRIRIVNEPDEAPAEYSTVNGDYEKEDEETTRRGQQ